MPLDLEPIDAPALDLEPVLDLEPIGQPAAAPVAKNGELKRQMEKARSEGRTQDRIIQGLDVASGLLSPIADPIGTAARGLAAGGKMAEGAAVDVMKGNIMPTTGRIIPNPENFWAAAEGKPLPDYESLTPVQQGVADAVKMVPAMGGAMAMSAAGVPPLAAFPATFGLSTLGETGDVNAAMHSAATAAMFPVAGQAARQLGAKMAGRLIENGAIAAGNQTAVKAIEVGMEQAGLQAFGHVLALPEYANATPDERKKLFARTTTTMAVLGIPGMAEIAKTVDLPKMIEEEAGKWATQSPSVAAPSLEAVQRLKAAGLPETAKALFETEGQPLPQPELTVSEGKLMQGGKPAEFTTEGVPDETVRQVPQAAGPEAGKVEAAPAVAQVVPEGQHAEPLAEGQRVAAKAPELMTPEEREKLIYESHTLSPDEFASLRRKLPLGQQVASYEFTKAADAANKVASILKDKVKWEAAYEHEIRTMAEGNMQRLHESSFGIQTSAKHRSPVNAKAVEQYGINLPEGYVREGDLYVYKPTPPPANAPGHAGEPGGGNVPPKAETPAVEPTAGQERASEAVPTTADKPEILFRQGQRIRWGKTEGNLAIYDDGRLAIRTDTGSEFPVRVDKIEAIEPAPPPSAPKPAPVLESDTAANGRDQAALEIQGMELERQSDALGIKMTDLVRRSLRMGSDTTIRMIEPLVQRKQFEADQRKSPTIEAEAQRQGGKVAEPLSVGSEGPTPKGVSRVKSITKMRQGTLYRVAYEDGTVSTVPERMVAQPAPPTKPAEVSSKVVEAQPTPAAEAKPKAEAPSTPAAPDMKGRGENIESQGSWKEIKKKRADEILKRFANSKWTSRRTGNSTGSYGVDEIMSADGQPVLKTSIDSARQKGRVYEFVPYKKSTPTPSGEAEMKDLGADVLRESKQSGNYVSNMFAAIDRDRAAMGKPPMEAGKTRGWNPDNQIALARMNTDPNWIPNLLADVKANPRPLLSWENAGVVWHRAKLHAEWNNALSRIAQAFDDGRVEDLSAAKADAQMFENAILDLDGIVGRGGTGSEAGRTLQAQKMGAGDDFSLIEMRLQKRAANGGRKLTDAESAETKKQFDELQAKNAELQKHLAERDEKISKLEADKAVGQMETDAKRAPGYAPEVMSAAKRLVDSLVSDETKAIERLKAKYGDKFISMGGDVLTPEGVKLSAQDLADLATIGAAERAQFPTKAGWDARMATMMGKWIEPHLGEIWDSSGKHLDAELNRLTKAMPPKKAEGVKRTVKKTDLGEQTQTRKETLKEKLEAAEDAEDGAPLGKAAMRQFAQGYARDLVESGVTNREMLIDRVHEALQEFDPVVTRREAMDAISGYGDFKELSKDEVSTTLRDLKGQMQQLGKLDDMASGTAPLKTGVERRSPSDIERQLIQQVNEAKKKGGFEITDPAKQLATALTARKTYYRNRLADLKQEIATRERIVKNKSLPPTDADLEAMKREYAALKEEHAKIFGDRKLTDEQKLKMALAGVERQIAEYDRRIKAGEFTKKPALGIFETPELKAARARRDALREQFEELRDLDDVFRREQGAKKLEADKKRLEETIAEQERKLREGDIAPSKQPVNRPADPVLESLMQRRDALNRQLAEARKKPEAQRAAEALQRRLGRMEKLIAEKEAKIAARDISTKPQKVNRPLPPGLEQAKQRLEALNRQIAEMRNPPKSPLEIAIQSFKARTAARIAELQERMAKDDYLPRARKPELDVSSDPVAMQLKGDIARVKRDFEKGLALDKAKRRSLPAKIYAGAKEVLNLPRAIWSAFDLSAVGRQGGFIGAGNPLRAVRSIGPMLKSMKERNAFVIEAQILSRPNAPLYAKSKLYLAALDEFKLSQQEEIMMSRYANAIPGVRQSNLAFMTYLNKLRADSFDAMLKSRESWWKEPVTQAEMDAIANYINVATGRGNFGERAGLAEGLATVFWSPRLVASRFQLLLGEPLYRGSWRTRALIAAEYGRSLSGLAVMLGLGYMAGASIETDRRSSDFLKLKFGNTRIDLFGGLLQNAVLLKRFTSGQSKDSDGGIRKTDVGRLSATFLRNKLTPTLGITLDARDIALKQKPPPGHPKTFADMGKRAVVPLAWGDLFDVMKEQGVPEGAIIEVLSLLGAGVQNYESKKQ